MKLSKENLSLWLQKIAFCVLSLFLLGIAGAINIKAALGSDPITVFYEGLSEFFHLDIGLTINAINLVLTAAVFFIDRKYIHLGTVLYVLILGYFVNIGLYWYNLLPIPQTFIIRFLVSIFGCILAFIGISIFIVVDIGIDPWSAISLIISKKTNKKFGLIRCMQDILTLGLGIIMGGTFGIITILCAAIGGPVIEKMIKLIDKMFKNMIKSPCNS